MVTWHFLHMNFFDDCREYVSERSQEMEKALQSQWPSFPAKKIQQSELFVCIFYSSKYYSIKFVCDFLKPFAVNDRIITFYAYILFLPYLQRMKCFCI